MLTIAGLVALPARTVAQDTAMPVPGPYSSFLFQALFPGNLEVAYNQITLGQNDTASIQHYLAAQPETGKAL
ncbi:MAG: hypothetical protein WBB18_13405 [Nodosilinea sp.]